MIDEELYQQAADELNSDRRRPHIWARACALASDDHDEARFLYTNLRVEELITERENASDVAGPSTPEGADATLALAPHPDDDVDDPLAEFSLGESTDDVPSSVSAPSGVSAHSGKGGSAIPDDVLQLDQVEINADKISTESFELADEPPAKPPLVEPDPELMADYTPEPEPTFDDTFTSEGIAEDEFAMELESFKAEENDSQSLLDIDEDSLDDTHLDLDSTTRLDLNDDEIADLVAVSGNDEPEIQTADFTESDVTDMTQANMQVLDAQTNELDDMLEDARYQPPVEPPVADDMRWLEEEPDDADDSLVVHDQTQGPVIYDDNPYRDELNRQADELGLDDTNDSSADFSQQIADKLRHDDTFPEPLKIPESITDPDIDSEAKPDTLADAEPDEHAADNAIPVAATVAASAAALATAGSQVGNQAGNQAGKQVGSNARVQSTVASAPDVSGPGQSVRDVVDSHDNPGFPLDLTDGRKGAQYSVYQRDNKAQAVKNGVSWSALFLTLPYLIYRQLFGTALAYIVVWIIAIGGLVLSGLAWLDAAAINPAAVPPLIQACTIGFALLAFIALVYLPFRHANSWRSERLENRGFELVAVAKAKNPGRAIARARRHSALG